MICPKCGAKINETDKFCTSCGETLQNSHQNQFNYANQFTNQSQENLNNQQETHQDQFNYSNTYSNNTNTTDSNHQDQYNYANNYSNIQTPKVTSEEDYLKAYVDKNYDSIKNRKFSIPLFFLGTAYLLYRKMFLQAILLLIINIILIYFVPLYGGLLILIINIVISLKFNQYYLNESQKKVDMIKQANADKSTVELLKICKKKGGTTIAVPIIFYSIFLVISFVSIFMYAFTTVMYEETTTTNEYNIIEDDNKIANLNFEIPHIFEQNDYSVDTTRMFTSNEDTDDTCNLTIKTTTFTNTFQTPEQYLETLKYSIDKNATISNIETKTFNNTNWSYMTKTTTDNITTNYYVTIKDKNIYVIEYLIAKDTNKDCSTAKTTLENSLKFD